MKCKNCKNKLKRNETFCGKCGCEVVRSQKNNKSKKIIALVCCFAIILSGTVGGLFFYNKKNKSNLDFDENYNCFTEGFTDILVTDEKSAIEAVSSVGDALGVKDAEKELQVVSVNQVGQDKFYRIQQYYNDIPVYSKSIVVSANESGNATGLTSNTSVLSNVDMDVNISEDEVINTVKKAAGDNITTSKPQLTILSKPASFGEYCLTYRISVAGENISNEYFVSANDGNILYTKSNIRYERVSASGIDNNKQSRDFYCEKINDDLYFLADFEKNISIYNAGNKNIQCKINDTRDGIDVYWQNVWYNMDSWFTKAQVVQSKNNEWKNKDAVTLMANLNVVYDYYLNNLQRKGFNNENGEVFAIINDNFNDDRTNAYSVSCLGLNTTVISMGVNNKIKLDTVAHEYTHSVIGYILDLDNGEAGALNEAYADIMGEIIENDTTWVHGKRNIVSPSENSYPNYYKGENWIDTSDTSANNDFGGVHKNSTVVSHAAYLMWNGIDGTEDRKIDSSLLAELWYRSILLLPSNANFSQCRNAVELSARIMLKNKQITEEQYNTVRTAFERVGIGNATFSYNETVKNKFDLSVLSREGTENVNFKLEVIKMPEIKVGPGLVNNEMPKLIMEKSALSGQQSLELEDGTYVLRITDLDEKQNNNQPINIKIIVKGDRNNTTDKVVVHTDFTDIITVELDNTEPTGNTTTTIPNETTNADIPEAEAIAAFERMLKDSDAIWGWNVYEGYDSHQFASMSNSEIIENWIACDGVPLGVYEVFSPDGTNGIKYTDEPSEENSYSDPKAKFWCSYELDADLVDWILKNVFGKEPDRSIATDKMYYSGNKVYVHSELGGGPGYIYKISDYEKLSDGKYYIYVEAEYEADVGVPDTYLKFIATPKKDAEKGIYWEIHSYEEYDGKKSNPTTNNTATEKILDRNSLIAKYGLSSQKQFVSYQNAETQNYPDDVFGIISTIEVDLNNDKANELLVIRAAKADDGSKGKILAEVYNNNNGNLALGASKPIYDISSSSAANIYLFYSDVLSEYCLIAESSSSGSSSGVNSWLAEIYTISENSIELYEKLERVPNVGIFADFETEFKKINVPFAKYCIDFDNKNNNSNYNLLCEVEHEIFGDSGSYMTRNHKLKIIDTTSAE